MAAVVDVKQLLEKYRALLADNHSLREENDILKDNLRRIICYRKI